MGRKSVKENKTYYQQSREAADLTRDEAAEKTGFISADKIEKIESEKTLPRPEEVLAMATAYKAPELPNYFCSHECPIGIKYIPEIKDKPLSQITIDMLATLNALERDKNRLIEIVVDGKIDEDEREDFSAIRAKLNEMAAAIDSLSLWVNKTLEQDK